LVVAVGAAWRFELATKAKTASFAVLLADGIAAQSQNNYNLAISLYRDALVLRPTSDVALFDLGDAEQFAGNATAARYYYAKTLRLNPSNPDALFNVGILDLTSQPHVAQRLFSRVVILAAQLGRTVLEAEADVNLGTVLLHGGHRALGLATQDRGYQLDPSLRSRMG
jgi:Flp pilus assembly protein TadD